jgi:hypothetical protein
MTPRISPVDPATASTEACSSNTWLDGAMAMAMAMAPATLMGLGSEFSRHWMWGLSHDFLPDFTRVGSSQRPKL